MKQFSVNVKVQTANGINEDQIKTLFNELLNHKVKEDIETSFVRTLRHYLEFGEIIVTNGGGELDVRPTEISKAG